MFQKLNHLKLPKTPTSSMFYSTVKGFLQRSTSPGASGPFLFRWRNNNCRFTERRQGIELKLSPNAQSGWSPENTKKKPTQQPTLFEAGEVYSEGCWSVPLIPWILFKSSLSTKTSIEQDELLCGKKSGPFFSGDKLEGYLLCNQTYDTG